MQDRETASVQPIEIAREKTKSYARSLWNLIGKHSQKGLSEERKDEAAPAPERYRSRHQWLLTVLLASPYVLVALFVFSLLWDFGGITLSPFGYTLQFDGLLRILSVSGMIGFLTNWLAITMLFKPVKPRPLLGHGLVPAQKDRIAYRLATAISQDLINPEIIKQKITERQLIPRYREAATHYIKGIIDAPEFREELKDLVVSYVDEMIADPSIRSGLAERILSEIEQAMESNTFERMALKAYSYLRGQEAQLIIEESLARLPGSVERGLDRMDDILDQLPRQIDAHSEQIENLVTNLLYKLVNQLDVHSLVEENLRNFEEERLEKMIKGATNEQLRYIQYLGAVLGTIGGFVIWEPLISVIVLGALTVAIVGLDSLLYRLK